MMTETFDEKQKTEYVNPLLVNSEIQLEFGIRNGKVVSISEIGTDERGLKCNCTCPKCNVLLIAKIGQKRQRHFAHKGTVCDIVVAQQTALHLLAKEIIEENKNLLFPGISVKHDAYVEGVTDHRVRDNLPIFLEYKKPIVVTCESVTLEKRISNIIPDLMITAKGRPCLVEIAVTHSVDDEKERKIEKLGFPLFEINISSLYGSDYSRDELKNAVLNDPSNRKWIYNPLFKEAEKWAKDEYVRLIHDAEMEIEKEDAKKEEIAKNKRQKREIGEKRIRETLTNHELYEKTLVSLKNDRKAAQKITELHFRTDLEKLPFFLNIPIAGEMVFPCDRRIWQSKLFDKFIYYRKGEEIESTVRIKKVNSWIVNYNDFFPIDWSLSYSVFVPQKQKKVSLLNDVIESFFQYLVYLGFLDPFNDYQEAEIRQTHSLIPPDKEHAEILNEVLNKVNWNDPDIDNRIAELLPPEKVEMGYDPWYFEKLTMNDSRYEERISNLKKAKEEREKKNAIEYASGLEEVKNKDFNGNEIVFDSYKNRWVLCVNCGKLYRSDQMVRYGGGEGQINKGICRECSDNRKYN